jgi:hypothetical protein
MEKFKQRKRTLKIRKISETMGYANKESEKKIDKLNKSKQICSCPICKKNSDVKLCGSNKGINKFRCNNLNHIKPIYFSTTTSYEAIEIYRDTMAKNLCLLAHTNSTINGTRLYNETSKYFVEYAHEALYEFIKNDINNSSLKLQNNIDLIMVCMDFSGSKLSKNKAIILAKANNNIFFEIVSVSNYLSSHQMISSIKEKLNISEKTQIVFLTDGEVCFVDSIKHFFPNAIHIRQFHSASCKGIIYIHFTQNKQEYTIRCLWDVVLNEGIPSKEVIKQRKQKAKKKIEEKKRKKQVKYSKLCEDVMIWKGTVYAPRGARRLLNKTKNKTTSKKIIKNTSTPDTVKLLFKGNLKEAKKLNVMNHCLSILKKLFGGLYITSNIVETLFNVKAKLSPHRTMKSGQRIMVCVLYCHLNLKNKLKEELLTFFKEKVITYDFLMKKVLYGSGLQKNKQIFPSYLEIIKSAYISGEKIIVHYCDAYKKHTVRMITPLKINTNEYNKKITIEAMCHLRNEKRTFCLDRIRDVSIEDPKPILI